MWGNCRIAVLLHYTMPFSLYKVKCQQEPFQGKVLPAHPFHVLRSEYNPSLRSPYESKSSLLVLVTTLNTPLSGSSCLCAGKMGITTLLCLPGMLRHSSYPQPILNPQRDGTAEVQDIFCCYDSSLTLSNSHGLTVSSVTHCALSPVVLSCTSPHYYHHF